MDISFKHNLEDMILAIGGIAEVAEKAKVQALNRTATGLRTDAAKDISKETGFTQKRIRPALKIKKASRRLPVAVLDARTGYAPNLIEFVSPSQRKISYFNQSKKLKRGGRKYKYKGVKAKAWGQKKTYDGAFIGTGKKGLTVFKRTSASRNKLVQVYGPSIRNTFISEPIQTNLKRQAAIRFDKNMQASIKNLVTRGVRNGKL